MDALDRCSSSVRLTDIQLLENEIRLAEQYVEKAQKLRRAAEKHGEGLPVYDDNIESGNSQQVYCSNTVLPLTAVTLNRYIAAILYFHFTFYVVIVFITNILDQLATV
jgi:hypothetical protein